MAIKKPRRQGVLATTLGAGLLLGMMPAASAFAAGGVLGDEDHGNTLNYTNIRWESWSADPGKNNAYSKFKEDMDARGGHVKGRKSTDPAEIDTSVKALANNLKAGSGDEELASCNDSQYVWATTFHDAGSLVGWIRKVPYTHGPNWYGLGTIENPAVIHGTAPDDATLTALKTWDANNGSHINGNPGYVILCSGDFGPPGDRSWTTTTRAKTAGSQVSTLSEPPHMYSCNVEVKRQISLGGKDPIGEDNLHDQAGVAKETNFGKLYDQYVSDLANPNFKWDATTIAAFKTAVDKAVATDKEEGCATVELDDANKKGMAEGGVLNIYQQSQLATLNLKTLTRTTVDETCNFTQKWDASKNAYDPVEKTCKTSNPSVDTRVTQQSTVLDTMKNTAFWQLLAVHCNPTQFKALLAATPGATAQESGDSTEGITAVIKSPVYKTQPDVLDFGNASNPNAAKATSASLGFYDKVCPLDCTSSKTAPGATAANGAKANVNSASPAAGSNNMYGASSEGKNTNKFEYFRDNASHLFSVDVWYPQNTHGVTYQGDAPVSTTVTRWSGGTPGLDDSAGGGKFQMATADKKYTLFTGQDQTQVLKNWLAATGGSYPTWSNATSQSMLGLERAFTVQADWASSTDAPQVFNFKWQYAPEVTTTLTDTLGFDYSGNPIATGATTGFTTKVQGECIAQFGSTTSSGKPALMSTTGTGGTTASDDNLVQGPTSSKPQDDGNNLFVNFVRSTKS